MVKQTGTIDAVKLLSDDHRAVEALFEKFEGTRGEAAKQKIVKQICEELTIHAMVEEQIFYPAVQEAVEDGLMDEAQVEHDSAKALILSLQTGSPSDAFYDAKVSVLKEQIEHHVREEERQRTGIFAQARKSDIDLDVLGAQIAELKAELKKQAKSGQLPSAELVSMAV